MPTTFYGRSAEDLVQREVTGEPETMPDGTVEEAQPLVFTGKTAAEEV